MKLVFMDMQYCIPTQFLQANAVVMKDQMDFLLPILLLAVILWLFQLKKIVRKISFCSVNNKWSYGCAEMVPVSIVSYVPYLKCESLPIFQSRVSSQCFPASNIIASGENGKSSDTFSNKFKKKYFDGICRKASCLNLSVAVCLFIGGLGWAGLGQDRTEQNIPISVYICILFCFYLQKI